MFMRILCVLCFTGSVYAAASVVDDAAGQLGRSATKKIIKTGVKEAGEITARELAREEAVAELQVERTLFQQMNAAAKQWYQWFTGGASRIPVAPAVTVQNNISVAPAAPVFESEVSSAQPSAGQAPSVNAHIAQHALGAEQNELTDELTKKTVETAHETVEKQKDQVDAKS